MCILEHSQKVSYDFLVLLMFVWFWLCGVGKWCCVHLVDEQERHVRIYTQYEVLIFVYDCVSFRMWSQSGSLIIEEGSNETKHTCMFEHLTTFSTLFKFTKVSWTSFCVFHIFPVSCFFFLFLA